MLPVRRIRLDQPQVVGQDRLDRFGRLGRRRREQRAERARLDRREDRPRLDRLEIVGHQVHDTMRRGAEGAGVHVE